MKPLSTRLKCFLFVKIYHEQSLLNKIVMRVGVREGGIISDHPGDEDGGADWPHRAPNAEGTPPHIDNWGEGAFVINLLEERKKGRLQHGDLKDASGSIVVKLEREYICRSLILNQII